MQNVEYCVVICAFLAWIQMRLYLVTGATVVNHLVSDGDEE